MTAAFRSHLIKVASLLLGMALGVAGSRPRQDVRAVALEASKDAGNGSVSPTSAPSRIAADSRHRAARPSESTEAYAAAWDSLKVGRLPVNELRAIQAKLMEEWALVDIEAALRAAFDEPSAYYVDAEKNLRDCCLEGIRQHPDLVWKLVSEGSFGFENRKLLDLWVKALREVDPMAILDRYQDFPPWELEIKPYEPESESPFGVDPEVIFNSEAVPWRAPESYPQRAQVIGTALHVAHFDVTDPAVAAQIMKRIARLGEGEDGDKVIQMSDRVLGQILSISTTVEGYQKAVDPGVRRLYLGALVQNLSDDDPAVRDVKLAEIPPDLRAKVEAGIKAISR